MDSKATAPRIVRTIASILERVGVDRLDVTATQVAAMRECALPEEVRAIMRPIFSPLQFDRD